MYIDSRKMLHSMLLAHTTLAITLAKVRPVEQAEYA